MARILYSGNRNASSWAFRAWLALKEQDIEFKEEIIDIRRPQRWKNLAGIGEFSPPAAIPVLVDEGIVIYDSNAIMEYANDIGEIELLPKDPIRRAQARSLVAWQHSTFSSVCPCLSFESAFYEDKKQLTANEIESAQWVYGIWEDNLNRNEGHYLVGEYSLADIMLIPSVLRLKSHLPVSETFPLTRAWIERLLARPFVREWLEDADALEPIYCAGYYSS